MSSEEEWSVVTRADNRRPNNQALHSGATRPQAYQYRHKERGALRGSTQSPWMVVRSALRLSLHDLPDTAEHFGNQAHATVKDNTEK
eukprot:CAMPEP_0202051606 /NCGR_PEP_ID=MMETSP0963-20130614/4729_1 /ASSEMBLY_ACC=CAM_ASM_000494 /TAXON_ID=4773 /ORGANISM="Schizochytrium aggregatum, Strain ATCC28209" /LENGTH=86 /DNA_ID=CAMNT_0048616793 /DNA_START=72 /DNA_END=333 /DNA_ORIENTATION=-